MPPISPKSVGFAIQYGAKHLPTDDLETGRKEKLAVNLFDLDRVDPNIRVLALKDRLDITAAINMDKNRPDERAVVFKCSLFSAACLCDLLRTHDKNAGDYPTRVYLSRNEGKSWTKLPGSVYFTVVEGDECILNPDIFPSTQPAVYDPLPPQRIDGGDLLED